MVKGEGESGKWYCGLLLFTEKTRVERLDVGDYQMVVFRRAGKTRRRQRAGRRGGECSGALGVGMWGSMGVACSVLVSRRLIALPSGWVGHDTGVVQGCFFALT